MEKFDSLKNTVDKQGNLRVDYLFSYWVFFWFLIYFFTQNVQRSSIANMIQKHFNPKLALYFAFIENFATFIYIILIQSKLVIIVKYLLMMLLVKILPIYLIKQKINLWNDSIVFICIFSIYVFYLFMNDETIYSVYERTFTSVKTNQNKTPMFYLFDKIIHLFYQ